MSLAKLCPVKISLSYVGKKWTLEIIRDMFFGKKRFSEFLAENRLLSKKVLSQRLKELEDQNFIEKRIFTKKPLIFEYQLTEKGYSLNKILYELSLLTINYYKDDILVDNQDLQKTREQMVKSSKMFFKIID